MRAHALGADPSASVTIPYGVDVSRFHPDAAARAAMRHRWQIPGDAEIVFAAGSLRAQKGVRALDRHSRAARPVTSLSSTRPRRRRRPRRRVPRSDQPARHRESRGPARRPHPGRCGGGLAASDVAVVPSVKDEAGNVDGLPNVVMEALASATPLVATTAGGIGHGGAGRHDGHARRGTRCAGAGLEPSAASSTTGRSASELGIAAGARAGHHGRDLGTRGGAVRRCLRTRAVDSRGSI